MVDQPRAITLGAALVFAAGLAGSGATLAVANGATESTSAASIACTANGGSVTAIATEHGSRCEHGAAAPPTSSPGATPGSPTTGISDNVPMNIDVPPGQTTDAASITAATASATAVGEQGEAAAAETPLGTSGQARNDIAQAPALAAVGLPGREVAVSTPSGNPHVSGSRIISTEAEPSVHGRQVAVPAPAGANNSSPVLHGGGGASVSVSSARIAVRSGGASVSTGGVSAHGTAVSVNVSSGEPGGPTVSVGIPSRVGMPSG